MDLNQNVLITYAAGAADMNQTIAATALSSVGDSDVPLARFTLTGHGYIANSSMVIQGLTSSRYNGNRLIKAVDTNTFDVLVKKFVAETPSGTTSLIFPGVTYPKDRYQLIGYELHLASACTTEENLVVAIDAARGTYWDTEIYDDSMNGVQNILYYPEEQIILEANDVLKFTWANAGNIAWGVKILTAKLNV
jgi:hypothetical protein